MTLRILLATSLIYVFFQSSCAPNENESFETEQNLQASSLSGINTARWMSDNALKLSKKKLNEIAIPTAHDAGTYAITSKSDIGPDRGETAVFSAAQKIGFIAPWAKAQERNVLQMLNDGIRHLDIRTCIDENGALRTCHSVFGDSLPSILNQVKTFTDQNPREIVILGFTKFWDVSYQNQLKQQDPKVKLPKPGLTAANWQRLIALLKGTLGGKFVDNTKYTPVSTLGDLWDNSKTDGSTNQIIAAFSTDSVPDDPVLWKNPEATGTWVGETDVNEYKSATQERINNALKGQYATQFWSVRSSITPDGKMIGNALIPLSDYLYPDNLQELADQTNPVILSWLIDVKKNTKVKFNMIWSDFYNRTSLVQLSLYFNDIPKVGPPVFTKAKTSQWFRWNCPPGFTDNGIFCRKNSYGRGAGFPWKFGDGLNDKNMFKRCEAKNGAGNCEKCLLIVYPKCRPGYKEVGCNICSQRCPSGWTDIGISCKK